MKHDLPDDERQIAAEMIISAAGIAVEHSIRLAEEAREACEWSELLTEHVRWTIDDTRRPPGTRPD